MIFIRHDFLVSSNFHLRNLSAHARAYGFLVDYSFLVILVESLYHGKERRPQLPSEQAD